METQKHFEMLKKSKLILKNAEKRQGHIPKDRKSSRELQSQHMMALMISSMQKSHLDSSRVTIHTSFFPPAYPPCTTPLSELVKTRIGTLRLETHHRGTCLFLRMMTPPTRMTAIMGVAEDEFGDGIALHLYQQEDEENRLAKEILDDGMILAVKEPYYKTTSDGEYGIRVDHLSDLIFLAPDDERVPSEWAPKLIELDKHAIRWKEEGNKLMEEKRYHDAIFKYSTALECQPRSEERVIIRRNRALAFLRTGYFDNTLCDLLYPFPEAAPASMQAEKTLFRASQALYALHRFHECYNILTALCDKYPENKEAARNLIQTSFRIQEQDKGVYNFNKLYSEAKKIRPPTLDHATYSIPVAIRQSPGRGNGLFTANEVKAGDLLLCEKAFAYSYAPGDENETLSGGMNVTLLINVETDTVKLGTGADLIKKCVQKLYKNPSLVSDFKTLHHGYYPSMEAIEVDGVPTVDTFFVERTIGQNSFGTPLTSRSSHLARDSPKGSKTSDINHSSGLWSIASRINHSCLGNCRRSFIGDVQIVRATTDMPANTELLFPYRVRSADDQKYEDIQKLLKGWGFVCGCELCLDAKATSKQIVKKREMLRDKLRVVYGGNTSNIMAEKVNTGKLAKVLAELESTYVKPADQIPRLALWDPYMTLTRIHSIRGQTQDAIKYALRTLEILGFVIKGAEVPSKKGEPSKIVIEKRGAVVDILVDCWVLLWTAYTVMGEGGRAKQARKEAVVYYGIVVGDQDSFEEAYGGRVRKCMSEGKLWISLAPRD